MCPLRFILVFLSALLAGFLVLKNINDSPAADIYDEQQQSDEDTSSSTVDRPHNSKILNGFWTFVDMASGRYLWRNLVSSKPTSD